jgi:hypothetical protein
MPQDQDTDSLCETECRIGVEKRSRIGAETAFQLIEHCRRRWLVGPSRAVTGKRLGHGITRAQGSADCVKEHSLRLPLSERLTQDLGPKISCRCRQLSVGVRKSAGLVEELEDHAHAGANAQGGRQKILPVLLKRLQLDSTVAR